MNIDDCRGVVPATPGAVLHVLGPNDEGGLFIKDSLPIIGWLLFAMHDEECPTAWSVPVTTDTIQHDQFHSIIEVPGGNFRVFDHGTSFNSLADAVEWASENLA